MFDTNQIGRTALAAIGALIFTAATVGAAVGPAEVGGAERVATVLAHTQIEGSARG